MNDCGKYGLSHLWMPMNDGTDWCRSCGTERTAQGTEAQRAETGTGSVHDGPVAESDAPKGGHNE